MILTKLLLLFCILGVAQVYSSESKIEEGEKLIKIEEGEKRIKSEEGDKRGKIEEGDKRVKIEEVEKRSKTEEGEKGGKKEEGEKGGKKEEGDKRGKIEEGDKRVKIEEVEKRSKTEGEKGGCSHIVEQLHNVTGHYDAFLKEILQLDHETYQYVIQEINKCGCEKESADKKCQEELINRIETVKKLLEQYIQKQALKLIEGLENICLHSGNALNEYYCCCKKGENCLKKNEHKSKEQIKECKPNKCNKAINELMRYTHNYLERQEKLKEIVRLIEELKNHKEEYNKDGKCTALGELLLNLHEYSCSLSYQIIKAYYNDDRKAVQYMEEAVKEIKECKS